MGILRNFVLYCNNAFQRKTVPGSGRPIFYANNKDVKIVQKILDDWVRLYEVDEPSAENYRVYDIHLMLFHLKNSAAGDEVWTSTNFSGREIEKDVYAYVPDIACEVSNFFSPLKIIIIVCISSFMPLVKTLCTAANRLSVDMPLLLAITAVVN